MQLAWTTWHKAKILTLTLRTTSIRIAFVSFNAGARWLMVLRGTASIEAAWTNAWILTTLRLASSIRWTILVDDAFGTTIWWGAQHAESTRAYSSIVDVTAFGIGSARAWHAWVCIAWGFGFNCCDEKRIGWGRLIRLTHWFCMTFFSSDKRVVSLRYKILTSWWASFEGIADEVLTTATNRIMIYNVTFWKC